jgi:Zn-dependent protease
MSQNAPQEIHAEVNPSIRSSGPASGEPGSADRKLSVKVDGGGWLVLAAILVLPGLNKGFPGPGVFLLLGLMLIFSLLLHEAAHYLAALSFDVPVLSFGVSALGPYQRRLPADQSWKEAIISMAGVLVNLLLFALTWRHYGLFGYWFCLFDLAIVGFNVLPLPAADGARAYKSLRHWVTGKLPLGHPGRLGRLRTLILVLTLLLVNGFLIYYSLPIQHSLLAAFLRLYAGVVSLLLLVGPSRDGWVTLPAAARLWLEATPAALQP